MNTIRTSEPRPKSEVELYYEACEAIDKAKRETPDDRELIARLTFKKNVALDKAHATLEERNRTASENVQRMFTELKAMTAQLASGFDPMAHGHLLGDIDAPVSVRP